MNALPLRTDSLMFRVHERELDEAQAFEDAAEKAGCALTGTLEALEKQPQHVQDRELGLLVNHLCAGNKYGRELLFSFLHKLAQDTDRKPSEVVIRWHFGDRP